jgi:hypothetical protein
MSLTHKPQSATQVSTDDDFPVSMPTLSGPVTDAYPELAQYASQMNDFWASVRLVLQRRNDNVVDPLNAAINNLAKLNTDTVAKLASLSGQVAALAARLGPPAA